MSARSINHVQRRGAVAPLMAILAIPLLGMIAFAVDIGYIALSKSELQNAADAAALAAVDQLRDPFTKWSVVSNPSNGATYSPSGMLAQRNLAMTNAKTAAQTYSQANKAGGKSVTVDTANDVTFGYLDGNGAYNPNPPSSQFPNTVEVTLRYDGGVSTNAKLPLFFGAVFGKADTTVTVSARATMYQGSANNVETNFASTNNLNGNMLPVAVKQTDWNAFFSTGFGADGVGPNGLPQFQIYPGGGGQPGSFGLLSLAGAKATNQPTYSNWILNGPAPADMTAMNSAGNLPLSGSQTNWYAGPGYKASLLPDFAARAGQPLILPLFDTAGGTGSNAWYHIVGFVGVTITSASGNIQVQPTAVTDPTLIVTNPVPAGSTSSNSFVFAPSKLTN